MLICAGPSTAADVAKVGTCLLGNCQVCAWLWGITLALVSCMTHENIHLLGTHTLCAMLPAYTHMLVCLFQRQDSRFQCVSCDNTHHSWCTQVALAQCVGDAECLENLICLQLCNGRKDETECQASTHASQPIVCQPCSSGMCCLMT